MNLEPIRKNMKLSLANVKNVNGSKGIIDFVHTTMTVDRDREVIKSDGVDFGNYQNDPVFLWSHNRKIPSIGRTIIDRVKFDSNQLAGPVQFDVDNDPFAEMIFKKYEGGFLHAVSIGFIPKAIGDPIKDGQTGVTIEEWEWLETSGVNIPANPEALRKEYEIAQKGSYESFAEPYYGQIKRYGDLYLPEFEKKVMLFVEKNVCKPKAKIAPAALLHQFEGSYEWISEKLHQALPAYMVSNNSTIGFKPDWDWWNVVSTFEKEFIFVVFNGPTWEESPVFKASYTVSEDGVMITGEPMPVKIEMSVVERAFENVPEEKRKLWERDYELSTMDVDPTKENLVISDGIDKAFPHHVLLEDGDGKEANFVVWKMVATAMIDLVKSDIPNSTKQEYYEHLRNHYEEFGKTAPDFYFETAEKEDKTGEDATLKELQLILDDHQFLNVLSECVEDSFINEIEKLN